MPFKLSSDKLVPVESIQELTKGSFEHLSIRIDQAIESNRKFFIDEGDADLARIATFKDKVVVGTSDGKYYSARYEDMDGQIHFGAREVIDVPLVDTTNVDEYVDDYINKAVDSILAGHKDEGRDQILALMSLEESVNDSAKDLASLVIDILSNETDWKRAYSENINSIKGKLGKIIESLDKSQIEPKYSPLYDGTLPEEKFPLYLEPARRDLTVIFDRLGKAEDRAEAVYLPFVEIAKSAVLEGEDKETVGQFVAFAEGLTSEIHNLREHVKIALENEQCSMCLGQIHDAIAEHLRDYEIAGLFVEHMATLFQTAE